MTMSIKPLREGFASEVTGLDLRHTQEENVRAALYQAFAERSVLVIRNQNLEPADFLETSRIFGNPMLQSLEQFRIPDCPLVGFISSKDKGSNGKVITRGSNWHTDHSHTVQPPKATILHAITLPNHGGDTQFCSMHLIYDALSEKLKKQADRINCLHIWMSRRCPRPMGAAEEGYDPRVWHPLVRVNPDTNRKAIYINTARIDDFQGIDMEDGFELLDDFMEMADQSEFEYRHKWEDGDVVIWDNRSVLHQANGDYGDEYRYLYRIIIEGEPVLNANGERMEVAA